MLEKYEDTISSPFTQSLKRILLTMLCFIMRDMRDTGVMNIEVDLIVRWWLQLKLVQIAGLRVDFALKHVKTIADACYFLIDNETVNRATLLRATRGNSSAFWRDR